MNQKIGVIFFFFLTIGLSISAVAQYAGEPGEEFWVDGPIGIKLGPAPQHVDVVIDYRGRVIYVWDESTYSPTLQAKNIVLRVFDKDGTSLVGPVQINTYDISSQLYPSVAVSADGTFVVAWESLESNRVTVRMQAFDADAQASGTEQILNEIATGKTPPVGLTVTPLTGGGYVAVWQSGPAGPDTGTNIQGRRIAANGLPMGSQFAVSTITGEFEGHSTVTWLNDGGFMAAWAYTDVWGRRFSANGTPAGDRFKINTTTNGTEIAVELTTHPDGRVAAVWRDGGDSVEPVTAGIRGRIYSPNVAALGNDFQINTLTAGDQREPDIAAYDEFGFFVIWESVTSVGDDDAPNSIQGRVVKGNDEFGSAQFQVNQWTPGSQKSPAVGGRNGRVATVWFSQGTDGYLTSLVQKGRGWAICGIYCDSFE